MSEDGWIFAYGSLMWDPGVPVAEAVPALLDGWHRSFCLISTEYRGSRDKPGLVLGLDADPASHCRGMMLRIAAADWEAAIAEVRARELVTDAYREITVTPLLDDGRRIAALTYVVRPGHDQYAGGLCLDEQAAMIAAASGMRGPNVDYLRNFMAQLHAMGLDDPTSASLAEAVARLREADAGPAGGADKAADPGGDLEAPRAG